ncbi:hypothetical protein, partial [Myxococcus sp. CA039A]
MAYSKTNWQDNVTPLSAANLNKIEQGIADAHAVTDTYTAADVLAKLKTVDGAGSGLDADTVRGYVPVNKAGDTITGDITVNGAIRTRNGLDLIFIGDDAVIEDFNTANSIRIKGRQDPTIADIY